MFDGHCLNDVCHVSDIVHPVVSRDNTTKNVLGRPGVILTGSKLSWATASMRLSFIGGTEDERLQAMALVDSWLDVEEPKPLAIGDDCGLYYLAVPYKRGQRIDFENGSILKEVSFMIPDPVRYGKSMEASSSSGTMSIYVDGNRGAAINITCNNAVRDNTTGLWGVRIDGEDYMRVPLGSGSHGVYMASDGYFCKVDNTASMLTTDSDWIVAGPGEHIISRELGTGTLTASWVERWL